MESQNKLSKTRKDYLSGKITKPNFITKMHSIHSVLFDYSEYMKDTDINSIEITNEGVFLTTGKAGIKMVCDKDDERITPIEILNFSEYESSEINIVIDILKRNFKDEFTFLDIGGNVGWYALNLSKSFPKIKIHIFEPIKKTFDYLKKNLALNRTKGIRAHNFGFSDKEQELIFYYYKEGSGNASIANVSETKDTEEIKCKVYKVDNFVRNNHLTVGFIKCDVEGAELLVFKGALEVLKRDKPIVFTEMLRKWSKKFNYNPNEIISIFKNIGYKCYAISGNSLKEFDLMNEKTTETNFIFIHPEKHKLK